MVPIRASSRCDKALISRADFSALISSALRARSISARKRNFNSPAAFSVNVTATMRSSVLMPSETIATIRPTRAVVLPVPAAASTNRVVPKSLRIRRLASASAKLAPRRSWHVPQLEEGCELLLGFATRIAALRRDRKWSDSHTKHIAARQAPLAKMASRALRPRFQPFPRQHHGCSDQGNMTSEYSPAEVQKYKRPQSTFNSPRKSFSATSA